MYAPEALLEIKQIVEWYNQIVPWLEERFKKNLLAEISAIKRSSLSRSFRYNSVRFAVVKRFPYAAHYTVDEIGHTIKIHAVLGFAQDSDANWKMRF
jgi:hypothetical protein